MVDPDNELVQAAKNGCSDAWSQLYTRYRLPLVSIVAKVLDSYHEAEDLVQDVFVRAIENIGTFNSNSTFFTWLTRIAINTAHNKRKYLALRGYYMDLPEIPDKTCPGTPESDLCTCQIIAVVDSFLDTFDAKTADVLRLRHLGEYQYDEIADALSIPLGTVKSTIADNRESLRQRIHQTGIYR